RLQSPRSTGRNVWVCRLDALRLSAPGALVRLARPGVDVLSSLQTRLGDDGRCAPPADPVGAAAGAVAGGTLHPCRAPAQSGLVRVGSPLGRGRGVRRLKAVRGRPWRRAPGLSAAADDRRAARRYEGSPTAGRHGIAAWTTPPG